MLRKLIQNHSSGDGSYREILKVSIPLILSTGSITLQYFVDRVFLTWYSPDTIAAAMPASILNYTIMSIFIGAAIYVSTFTAQYIGSKQPEKVGSFIWQGLYFSILAGLIVLPLLPLTPGIFKLAGHAARVQQHEIDYFQILILSGFPVTASSAISGFFSGQGKTKTVMWVSFITTGINIILDYLLIFGVGSIPAMGIKGAAIATVAAQYGRMTIYAFLFLSKPNREYFNTLTSWRFHWKNFRRLMRFGLPNGIHFFLEMTGFTILILLVGRLGINELAATNITFNINHLIFMPLMGFSMSISILVGQRIGEKRPAAARHLTWSASHLGFGFVIIFSLAYALLPELFLAPYKMYATGSEFVEISRTSVRLLKFVAVYSIFDCMNIIFSAAVKGAGDTRFVMWTSVTLSWLVMVIPSFLVTIFFNGSIYLLWTFATAYIILIGVIFLRRFLQGKWETMSVIS